MSLICLSIVNKKTKLQRQRAVKESERVGEGEAGVGGRETGLPAHVLRVCVREEVVAGKLANRAKAEQSVN